MRLAAVATVSALAAVLLSLGIAARSGWFDGAPRTVVATRSAQLGGSTPARATLASARPLVDNGFDPAAIYAARSPGVVTIYSDYPDGSEAQGSGFVVTRSGLILTSSHVITTAGGSGQEGTAAKADAVYVEFADRDRVPASIVGWDLFDDVGVIKVDPGLHPLAPVPLGDSGAVRVGEPVAAIGSPFGNANSLAVGVVSGIRRSIDSLTSSFRLADAIQVDAPINHGNSGGPVFDADGQVIGIAAQIRSDSGLAEGVGFAVPIDSARRSLGEIVARGRVDYAFLGVRTLDLTPSLSRSLKLAVKRGALVTTVEPGSAAEKAGLRGGSGEVDVNGIAVRPGGDVILAIDGARVRAGDDLARIVSEQLHPGQKVTVALLRDAKRLEITLTLGARQR